MSSSGSFLASVDHFCVFFHRWFLTPGSVSSWPCEKLDCIKHFMQERFCQNFHHQNFQEETWSLQLLKCRAPLIWGAEEHRGSGLAHRVQTFNKFPLVVPSTAQFPVCAAIPKLCTPVWAVLHHISLPAVGQVCAVSCDCPWDTLPKDSCTLHSPVWCAALQQEFLGFNWQQKSEIALHSSYFRFYYVRWIKPTIFFPGFLRVWFF